MTSAAFDGQAAEYDAWYDRPQGQAIFAAEGACLQALLSDYPRPYLEVGVGSGRFAQALGIEYGIDPARRLLRLARSRGIEVIQGVGERLPFAAGSLGAALIAFTICFVADPIRVLAEVVRVLGHGGGLVLGFIPVESPWAQGEALKKQILEGMTSFTGGGGQDGLGSLVKIDETSPPGMTLKKFPNSAQHNVPAYTAMFVFYIVLYIANSIFTEKQEGTFRRLLAAPVNKAALMAGKLLPYFAVTILQAAVMFTTGRILFNLDLGDIWGLIIVTVALGAAATSLGLMASAIGKTFAQVSGLANIILLVLAALGGAMVPSFVMPQFMQDMSRVTPHYWAIAGYQDILVRGLGADAVLLESGVLLGFGAVFFFIAVWRFRFN